VARSAGFESNGVIQTAGEFFLDGSVLELVRVPSEPEEVNLLLWNGTVQEVAAQVEHAGRKYAPAAIEANVMKALHLPTHVAPAETATELFEAVHGLLARHLRQLNPCITAMTFAIFASWCSPVLPMAPILWIFAPTGSPRNLALRLLSLLCRRPLSLVGLKRGDIPRLPMSLQTTLLLDEPDLRPEMQMILQSSTHRGARIIGSHGLLEFYGPKIICSHKLPTGTPLETEALKAALIPTAGYLPPLDKKMEEEITDEFQARLLGYLLRNASSVQNANFAASQFTLPTQDLARTLDAAVIGDRDLQKRMLLLLGVQDEEVRADRARTCDAVVLEAVLFFIHTGGWSKVRTDNIAEKVGAIYKGRGSDQQPSAETVGRALRRLGIPSGRINRAGNGIELDVGVCRLIHRLALSHGVRAMSGAPRDDCRYCRELEPEFAQTAT
jgi:hypothetical protein